MLNYSFDLKFNIVCSPSFNFSVFQRYFNQTLDFYYSLRVVVDVEYSWLTLIED